MVVGAAAAAAAAGTAGAEEDGKRVAATAASAAVLGECDDEYGDEREEDEDDARDEEHREGASEEHQEPAPRLASERSRALAGGSRQHRRANARREDVHDLSRGTLLDVRPGGVAGVHHRATQVVRRAVEIGKLEHHVAERATRRDALERAEQVPSGRRLVGSHAYPGGCSRATRTRATRSGCDERQT